MREIEIFLEWHSPEHRFDKKNTDWYWILGIVSIGVAVLSFYFGNFLFGIFIIIAALTVGTLSYKDTKIVPIKVTSKGIAFDKHFYPWSSYQSFWIEDDHMHGPRILLHPINTFLPLVSIPINEEADLDDVRDALFQFLEEEPLQESIIHKWFDKLLAK
ncbi:MAG TPA: hypothetical protein VJB58_00570 [Candidatus Paceibacterota bacterium]